MNGAAEDHLRGEALQASLARPCSCIAHYPPNSLQAPLDSDGSEILRLQLSLPADCGLQSLDPWSILQCIDKQMLNAASLHGHEALCEC